jgi:NAD(P)-dependent dehydrogenase (short-subunit alcohol dehydrogenase family)
MFHLDGKRALITGAGSGIGEAIAHLFARQGAQVLVADVQTDAAEHSPRRARYRAGDHDRELSGAAENLLSTWYGFSWLWAAGSPSRPISNRTPKMPCQATYTQL